MQPGQKNQEQKDIQPLNEERAQTSPSLVKVGVFVNDETISQENSIQLPKRWTLYLGAVIIFIAIIVCLIVIVYKSVSNNSSSANSSVSTITQDSHDKNTVNDLYLIGQAIQNQPPNSLESLDLKGLHYSLSDYQYTAYPYDESGADWYYRICADFDSSTLPSDPNSDANAANLDGTQNNSIAAYSIHAKGTQCFDNNLGPEDGGVSVVENQSESPGNDGYGE